SGRKQYRQWILQNGVGWTTGSSMQGTRRLAGQPPATGLPITPPIVPIGLAPPSPGSPHLQLFHQSPQARRRSLLLGFVASPCASAASETAPRMAARRSEIKPGPPPRGGCPAG